MLTVTGKPAIVTNSSYEDEYITRRALAPITSVIWESAIHEARVDGVSLLNFAVERLHDWLVFYDKMFGLTQENGRRYRYKLAPDHFWGLAAAIMYWRHMDEMHWMLEKEIPIFQIDVIKQLYDWIVSDLDQVMNVYDVLTEIGLNANINGLATDLMKIQTGEWMKDQAWEAQQKVLVPTYQAYNAFKDLPDGSALSNIGSTWYSLTGIHLTETFC